MKKRGPCGRAFAPQHQEPSTRINEMARFMVNAIMTYSGCKAFDWLLEEFGVQPAGTLEKKHTFAKGKANSRWVRQ
jgi:hypothetical protein